MEMNRDVKILDILMKNITKIIFSLKNIFSLSIPYMSNESSNYIINKPYGHTKQNKKM